MIPDQFSCKVDRQGKHKEDLAPRDMIYTWGKQLNHPSTKGQIFWSLMSSVERLAIRSGNEKRNLHVLRYREVTLAYTWFNFKKRPVLWPFRHTLYICFDSEEGNAFKSQKGVIMVKLGDHCGCDFRRIPVLLYTWIFWAMPDSRWHKDSKIPPPSPTRFFLRFMRITPGSRLRRGLPSQNGKSIGSDKSPS